MQADIVITWFLKVFCGSDIDDNRDTVMKPYKRDFNYLNSRNHSFQYTYNILSFKILGLLWNVLFWKILLLLFTNDAMTWWKNTV